jgi:hypothetical protein
MGTVVHKILEILAVIKKEFQDKKTETVTVMDDCIGEITVCWDDFIKPSILTEEEISAINKSRSAKSTYVDKPFLSVGQKRLGREFFNSIILRVFGYYTEKLGFNHSGWNRKSTIRDIVNWSWMTVERDNGAYDPRLSKIVQPEQKFEIELDQDWAAYYYNLPEGELSGNIKLKGTIDLIVDIGDGCYEVVDYKTGARKNWADNTARTRSKLENDIQLNFYNYAMKRLFPDIEHTMITIFFIRDGGPFTLGFTDEDLAATELKLKDTVNEILSCENPIPMDPKRDTESRSGLCRFCKFAKKEKGGKSYCQMLEEKIDLVGIDKVIFEETEKGHSIGTYSAPG